MIPNIYILPIYANQNHLENHRYETEHESKIKFSKQGLQIELSEVNSLIENKYSLNLTSAKYEVEGSTTEIKEAKIHHHPKGHPFKHLQFKLKSKHEVIRIFLDDLNDEDYQKCIKGFLYLTQRIIRLEKDENNISENLQNYFFNEKIKELRNDKNYLLIKIKQSYERGNVLDDNNNSLNKEKLIELKSENHLLPFLEWED